MTSHTDNPYRKYWLESFQPPLSPHITFTSLTIFFHLSLLCSHFLLPYLKSPCLSHAIASLHHPFQWLMFPLHLSSVAPFIISTNECTFFFISLGFLFLFIVMSKDIICASLKNWARRLWACLFPICSSPSSARPRSVLSSHLLWLIFVCLLSSMHMHRQDCTLCYWI